MLIGVQDDTPVEDVEMPWLVYDEALKPRRYLVKLVLDVCPTDLKHARSCLKFVRPPGDDDGAFPADRIRSVSCQTSVRILKSSGALACFGSAAHSPRMHRCLP